MSVIRSLNTVSGGGNFFGIDFNRESNRNEVSLQELADLTAQLIATNEALLANQTTLLNYISVDEKSSFIHHEYEFLTQVATTGNGPFQTSDMEGHIIAGLKTATTFNVFSHGVVDYTDQAGQNSVTVPGATTVHNVVLSPNGEYIAALCDDPVGSIMFFKAVSNTDSKFVHVSTLVTTAVFNVVGSSPFSFSFDGKFIMLVTPTNLEYYKNVDETFVIQQSIPDTSTKHVLSLGIHVNTVIVVVGSVLKVYELLEDIWVLFSTLTLLTDNPTWSNLGAAGIRLASHGKSLMVSYIEAANQYVAHYLTGNHKFWTPTDIKVNASNPIFGTTFATSGDLKTLFIGNSGNGDIDVYHYVHETWVEAENIPAPPGVTATYLLNHFQATEKAHHLFVEDNVNDAFIFNASNPVISAASTGDAEINFRVNGNKRLRIRDSRVEIIGVPFFLQAGGSELNFHRVEELTDDVTGPWASAQSRLIRWERIGTIIQMTIRGVFSTATISLPITFVTIPVDYRPCANIRMPANVKDNATNQVGTIEVMSDGTLVIYADANLGSFTGSGDTGYEGISLSWQCS